jgi:hypothetical protein
MVVSLPNYALSKPMLAFNDIDRQSKEEKNDLYYAEIVRETPPTKPSELKRLQRTAHYRPWTGIQRC